MRIFENQQSVEYNPNEKRVVYAEDMNEIGEYINAGMPYMRARVFVDPSAVDYETSRDELVGLSVEDNRYVKSVVATQLTTLKKSGFIVNNESLTLLNLPALINTPILKISNNPLLEELYLTALENAQYFEFSFNPLITTLDISTLYYSSIVSITDNASLNTFVHNLPSNLISFDFSRNGGIGVFQNPNWDGCENLSISDNPQLEEIFLSDFLLSNKMIISGNPILHTLWIPNFLDSASINFSNNPLLVEYYVPSSLQCSAYYGGGCALKKQMIDDILRALDNGNSTDGYCDLSGGTNEPPSGDGLSSMASLQAKGWTVITN